MCVFSLYDFRLYEEWEENDEEKLEEDELPDFQRKPKPLDPSAIENVSSELEP